MSPKEFEHNSYVIKTWRDVTYNILKNVLQWSLCHRTKFESEKPRKISVLSLHSKDQGHWIYNDTILSCQRYFSLLFHTLVYLINHATTIRLRYYHINSSQKVPYFNWLFNECNVPSLQPLSKCMIRIKTTIIIIT